MAARTSNVKLSLDCRIVILNRNALAISAHQVPGVFRAAIAILALVRVRSFSSILTGQL